MVSGWFSSLWQSQINSALEWGKFMVEQMVSGATGGVLVEQSTSIEKVRDIFNYTAK